MNSAYIELRARVLYEQMTYDGPGEKPKWVEGGNSLKQDEARETACLEMALADEDGFIDWGGGPCPVPPDTLVDVKIGASDRIEYGYPASMWQENVDWWQHKGKEAHSHIIAFRIAEDEDYEIADAAPMDAGDEQPLSETTHLFVGKTIAKMDATACNLIEFLFTDGTRVALHIDCDSMGLPKVDTCTTCVEITTTAINKGDRP